jgi:hypothetical protein
MANTVTTFAAEPVSGEFEEESDWRFEDEMQLGDTGASLDLPNGEAPTPPSADPNESSFAELGDPESWDLLSTTAAPEPRIPHTAPPPSAFEPVSSPIEVAVPAVPVPAASVRAERSEIATPAAQNPVFPLETEFSPALQRGAWIAVAALIAVAGWASLVPVGPLELQAGVVSVGPLELDSLRARQVENASAGPNWVVSGELRNPSAEPVALGAALAVSLLDRSGERIDGASAIGVPTLSMERLREDDPVQLREAAEVAAAELGSRILAPGGRVAIDAVFADPARGAARFAVETQPLRAQPAATVAEPAPVAIDPAFVPSDSPAN